jgi:hypothetical protein
MGCRLGKTAENAGFPEFFQYFFTLNFIIISQKKQGDFGDIQLNKAIREI